MKKLLFVLAVLLSAEAYAVGNSCHYGNGWTSGATVPTIFSWNNESFGEFGLYYKMRAAITAPPYWSYCNQYTGSGCNPWNGNTYVAKSNMPYNYALRRTYVKYHALYKGTFYVTGGYAIVRGGDNECPTDGNWQDWTATSSCYNPGGWINPAWPKTP